VLLTDLCVSAKSLMLLEIFGADERSRTSDLLITNRVADLVTL